jgi:hypothetical protein
MTQAGKPVILAANLRIAAPITLWPGTLVSDIG